MCWSIWSGMTTVHPRVCGEHSQCSGSAKQCHGSSPRVRGTWRRRQVHLPLDRFIPACAGNISLLASETHRLTVHPRVCGEHLLAAEVIAYQLGSSPRVRGTFPPIPYRPPQRRFIPACAGNISATGISPHPAPVHPRVCGEHKLNKRLRDAVRGSSPRVRGTWRCGPGHTGAYRFIPACAGNIPARQCAPAERPGSSPRVRGTSLVRYTFSILSRFIPACAGNMPATLAVTIDRSVHPRVCGEHPQGRSQCPRRRGSSPRVRGTSLGTMELPDALGFIPACAGNI